MKHFLFAATVLVGAFATQTPANAQWGGYSSGSGDGSCGSGSRSYGSGSSWGGDDFDSGTLQIIGLTNDQRLICFDENNPGSARNINRIGGLNGGDTSLIGIDYRPANRMLYGVGNNGGVYTIDPNSAFATLQFRLTIALIGRSFGVDVNPAADALRVTSNTGQNLRHPFTNAAAVATINDGTLNYMPGVAATGIAGSAYTNNDSDPNTATTLYDLDTNLDQVAIQSPANAGTLAATGKLTVDAGLPVGFDIYSTIRNNTTVALRAFASLVVGGETRLYAITLFTGKASSRGAFRAQDQVIGIAIPLNQL